MKATQVSKENGVVKFNIEFSTEEFKDAVNKAYLANRSKFQIDGFRKGKAPRKIIESHYGHDVFWDEALNELLEKGYYDALKEMDLEVISQPSFESPEIKKDEPVVLTGTVQVFPEMDKPFSGGNAENYELKLGSGQFIPGFEDQLVGKDAGEEVDVEVVFPGDYHAEELAGKPALFKCKIHEIKKEILPEIDDELASDVSEFETLAEYKKDLKKKLQEAAKETDLSVMKDRVLEKLYNENDIKVPEVMINNEVENMLYDMNQSLSAQGLGLQQYVEWTGKTLDELREETKPEAEKRIRTRVLLKNIIRMEKLDVEDEEINELMEDFGKQYGMTVDQVKEMAGSETENYFREDAQTKKAIDWLFDNAKLVEKKAEKKAKAKKEEKKED